MPCEKDAACLDREDGPRGTRIAEEEPKLSVCHPRAQTPVGMGNANQSILVDDGPFDSGPT
jgi:hypothetical protein